MITLTEIIHIALGGLPFLIIAGPFLWRQLGNLRREQKEWKEEMREELREYKEELREARQRTDQIMAILMANAGLSYPAKKEQ